MCSVLGGGGRNMMEPKESTNEGRNKSAIAIGSSAAEHKGTME